MSTKVSLVQMIQQIEMTLNTMKMGIDLYKNSRNDQLKRDAGIRDAVVFGRAVTNSLQKLRGTELGKDEFDDWYKPWQTKLKEDKGFKFLYKLRSQILKEGILKTSSGIKINHLNIGDAYKLMKKAPFNVKSMFIGDAYGRSGFEVVLPDGSIENYYIKLPDYIDVETSLEINKVPHYKGYYNNKITNTTTLLDYYYKFLYTMVADAKLKFLMK
ncbi:hypothetical protein [Limosilactobacillus reuteri]|uniref:hypothetical protein n=1 Tax=Limosilactobacillus reuteri TaxID=1598 RepID=UPI001E59FF09|nr:hypothetical protein [Limosilactobacillus reuteri]MCC4516980.1 hypothetical protein [Limosilactobacillus reuteri]